MNKLVKASRKLGRWASKNSPSILTGVGILGFVSTVAMAVKETPEAQRRIFEKSREKLSKPALFDSDEVEIEVEGLTRWETIKAAAPAYLPAAGMGVISIGCFICSNSISTKRNAAMVGVAELYRSRMAEYQEAVIQRLGDKEEKAIRKEIADRHYKESPPVSEEIVKTGNGEYLCYEPYSNTYFLSCSENIHDARNRLNNNMMQERYMSFNEWLDILDLPERCRPPYDYIGWNYDSDGLVDIDVIYTASENGTPCATIDYITEPHDNYRDVY